MNMCLAAVAIGFKEKLHDLMNDDANDDEKVPASQQPQSPKRKQSLVPNSKAAKFLGRDKENDKIKIMLQVIWGDSKSKAHQMLGRDKKHLKLRQLRRFRDVCE